MSRIVLKVGSSSLSSAGGGLDGIRVDALVDALADHVAALRAAGNLPAPRKKRRSRKKATKVDKA